MIIIILLLLLQLFVCEYPKIINIPLDERFTTRVAFLNMARITPFQIESLPQQLLPSLKKYNNPQLIINWLSEQAEQQTISSKIYILSLQTLLYGSLIASRISNDSLSDIKQRLDSLIQLKNKHPEIQIYASAVVMRIPAYSFNFEEPDYWSLYGAQIYTYSYYLDKYNKLQDPNDLSISNQAKLQIPDAILSNFLERRKRNQNILLALLDAIHGNKQLFKALYITLDDNAQYGLNVAQAEELRQKVIQYKISDIVRIYPGADQVSFTLLAKFMTEYTNFNPKLAMNFRNSSTIKNIPNYEGIPLVETIQQQIKAAGGLAINGTLFTRGNITLLINNFDQTKQIQAPRQFQYTNQTINYNQAFLSQVCFPIITQYYGFIDNRYSNGADVNFIDWMINTTKKCSRGIEKWAYAGWNTNGNTVGTVVSNSIILFLTDYIKKQGKKQNQIKKIYNYLRPRQNYRFMGKDCSYCSPCEKNQVYCSNGYFNILRILQDRDWQATLRQNMISYIEQTPGDDPNNLATDLQFYQKYSLKSMQAKLKVLQQLLNFQNQFQINVYYPWNRTFQIGIYGQLISQPPSNQRLKIK